MGRLIGSETATAIIVRLRKVKYDDYTIGATIVAARMNRHLLAVDCGPENDTEIDAAYHPANGWCTVEVTDEGGDGREPKFASKAFAPLLAATRNTDAVTLRRLEQLTMQAYELWVKLNSYQADAIGASGMVYNDDDSGIDLATVSRPRWASRLPAE